MGKGRRTKIVDGAGRCWHADRGGR